MPGESARAEARGSEHDFGKCTSVQHAALWVFEQVDTVRKALLQRAGRLTRPGGRLTLTISGAGSVKEKLLAMLDRLRPAA